MRGELRDDGASGFTYLRNKAFTSYIALEFYDEEKRRFITAGCCFDVYGEKISTMCSLATMAKCRRAPLQ